MEQVFAWYKYYTSEGLKAEFLTHILSMMKRASPPPLLETLIFEKICPKRYKEYEDLKDHLDCCICFNTLRPGNEGVLSCANGHYVCDDCFNELKTWICPGPIPAEKLQPP